MPNSRARVFGARLLAATIALTGGSSAAPRRAIPDDNLAYPVLATLNNGSTGSGFYLNDGKELFFVTAKHVLFDKKTNALQGNSLQLLSYSRNINEAERNLLTLDLSALSSVGNIKPHPSEDVAIIKLGDVVTNAPAKADSVDDGSRARAVPETHISFLSGVTVNGLAPSGFLSVALENVDTFDQVLVGNDVIMFGYPTSLALLPNVKIDFQRPLLRKGIVAGENPPQHSIILDCPSYQGDSGGPIIEVDANSPFETHFKIIGVMSEFVPFADTWENQHFRYINTTLQNSGYSIATPMDFVLELIK